MADSQLHNDLRDLTEAIKSLHGEVADLRKDRTDGGGQSVSSIRVDAGGAAIWGTAWVSTAAASLMLGMAIIGALWASSAFQEATQERAELRRTDNDIRDYMAAIYQAAPELQKRIEAEKAEKAEESK